MMRDAAFEDKGRLAESARPRTVARLPEPLRFTLEARSPNFRSE